MHRQAMRLPQLERELEDAGYLLSRVRGTHRHYRHQVTGQRVSFSYHRAGRGDTGLSWRKCEMVLRDMRRAERALE